MQKLNCLRRWFVVDYQSFLFSTFHVVTPAIHFSPGRSAELSASSSAPDAENGRDIVFRDLEHHTDICFNQINPHEESGEGQTGYDM